MMKTHLLARHLLASRKWNFSSVVFANLVAVALVLFGLRQLYDQTIREAEVRSQNIAAAIDLHLSSEFRKIDLSILTVATQLNDLPAARIVGHDRMIRALVVQQKKAFPEAEGWSVTDAEGKIIYHEGEQVHSPFTLADRDYFQNLKSGLVHGLVVTKPIKSKLTGSLVVVFARAIHDKLGQFRGAVVVPLSLGSLNKMLSGFDLGQHDTITLRDIDLGLITRFPEQHDEYLAFTGDRRVSGRAENIVLSGKPAATYHAQTPFDGLERILSFRKLAGAPIHVFVGIAKHDFMKEWRTTVWYLSSVFFVLIVFCNIAVVLFNRQWRQQQRSAAALREGNARLERMAYYDELTGLPNRALLAKRMREAMAGCGKSENRVIAICFLDLDGFKDINGQHGYSVGNALLVEVAKRLNGCTRDSDTVARLGGDEFVVLLCDLKDERDVYNAASRILEISAEPYCLGKIHTEITFSLGLSLYPSTDIDEPDVLLRQADQAMCEAKRRGKNCLCAFDIESEKRFLVRQALYGRLVEALEKREFRLHYQPKVCLEDGAIMGVEALLRWQHPERGVLLPGEFLATIEDTELAFPLGEWILHEALQQQRYWKQQGIELRLSVNIFGIHLQRADFVERLGIILNGYPDIDPRTLELEIVETTALDNLKEITSRIEGCKNLGVSFSLDDFGTGYSSLTYLRQLPVNNIKIDRSFVRDMLANSDDHALVESMVSMAHSLDRQVIAEGVETIEHGVILIHCGCNCVQGYGIARPMPPEKVPQWLADWVMPERWAAANTEKIIFFGKGINYPARIKTPATP